LKEELIMASKKQTMEKFLEGKVATALNYAKDFKIGVTDEEREIMARGYECIKRPEQYQEMGFSIDTAIEEATSVLKRVLGIEEPTIAEPVVEEPVVEEPVVEETVNFIDPVSIEPDMFEEMFDAEAEGRAPRLTQEADRVVWFLTVRHRRTKKFEVKLVELDELDHALKTLRSVGYSFVCVLSSEKADSYVKSNGSCTGMKGIIQALDGKLTVTVYEYLKELLAFLSVGSKVRDNDSLWVDIKELEEGQLFQVPEVVAN
jgi:hypothetical protein